MYLGRKLLGSEVTVSVLCVDGDRVPAAPTAVPTLAIYSDSGRIVSGLKMPPMDRYQATGFFQRKFFLDGSFSLGRYRAVARYTIGSYQGMALSTFEVIGGGHAGGTPIATYFYRRPHANFIVQQTDAGELIKRRNPSL